jgi:hypothetical protein
MKELELITLYCYLCECYSTDLCWYNQHFSNNSSPANEKITDVELLTIYFYCRRYENRHLKTQIWDFANRYMQPWFPTLPNYANFNNRINNLSDAINALIVLQLDKIKDADNQCLNQEVLLVDSLPIMLCSGKRQAKVARELSDKTFCATKSVYYFGVKLHILAFQRPKRLPLPEYISITPASENDLTAIRPILPQIVNKAIFGDKAYSDKPLNERLMTEVDTYIYTPVKLVKGESERIREFNKAADDLFSTMVSRVRQPIESLFNWLIEKANIQNASKIRATKGLTTHIYGSIATALFFWMF